MFPALVIYEKETGNLRFTHPVEDPEPIESYIGMLGKFRHLDKEQIAHLKKTADDRVRILKAIAQSGTDAINAVS